MKWLRKSVIQLVLVCCLVLGGLPASSASDPAAAVTATAEAAYNKATIKEVQKKLNKKGYDCGTPDGIAGKGTKAAIKKYQKDKGLKVSGTVNKTLLKSLNVKEVTASASSEKNKEVTVYITKTGAKYHRGSCRYLKKSKIAISLTDAKKNYDPCSVCNP